MTLAAAVSLALWHNSRAPNLGLAALTLLGTLNHVAFLAFAAPLWIVRVLGVTPKDRTRTAAVAVVVLMAGLALGTLMLGDSGRGLSRSNVPHPGPWALATGLLTGRFDHDLQPPTAATIGQIVRLASPGPLVLSVPLAALAFVRRDARRIAACCGFAAAGAMTFAAGTWLPDIAIAAAPARLAWLALVGIGLSWLSRGGPAGSKALAIAASAAIGLSPYLVTADVKVENVEMQAFIKAAAPLVGESSWSADRLATTRELLLHGSATLREHRVEHHARVLGQLPPDQRVVAFTRRSGRALGDAWLVPEDLAYLSPADFVAAQSDGRWLAVALRGPAYEGFCRGLLNELTRRNEAWSGPLAVLAHLGHADAVRTSAQMLDVDYGEKIGVQSTVPAHFTIATDPGISVVINRRRSEAMASGLVMGVFDQDMMQAAFWTVPDCANPTPPPIVDRRLQAAYLVEGTAGRNIPAGALVSRNRVDVPLDEKGNEWLGTGWSGPEAPGAETLRWTAAPDAELNVVVTHRQGLLVRLAARLAEKPPGSNNLTLLWNGTVIAVGLSGAIDGVWEIPATVVKRGLNTLTLHVSDLVSPEALHGAADRRRLGAAVTRMSIEPTQSSSPERLSPADSRE